MGDRDIYVSTLGADGVWTKPANLGRTVNTASVELSPFMAPDGKTLYFSSNRPGGIGGFGANHVLRQSLVFLGMPTLQHEAYIGGVNKLFDENGMLDGSTEKFLRKFLTEYEAWVARF